MSKPRIRAAALAALIATGVSLAGVVSAPPATAKPSVGDAGFDAEVAFLEYLQDQGFTIKRAIAIDAVKAGYSACDMIRYRIPWPGQQTDAEMAVFASAGINLCPHALDNTSTPKRELTSSEEDLMMQTALGMMGQVADNAQRGTDSGIDTDSDEDLINNNKEFFPGS
jgi:hypothetical protein